MPKVHLKSEFRSMHTQVIGTTNAGKTASVILPWVARDIELGRGLLIVDGKSDRSFLDQLYARTLAAGRNKDFRVFSLAEPNFSATFNPFAQGSPEQITERVFSSFNITDEYYRAVQYSALRTLVDLLMNQRKTPMPGVIRTLLRDRKAIESWIGKIKDRNLVADVAALLKEDTKEFDKKYSGLVTALGHFSQGATAPLFNTEFPEIILADVIKKRQICYFQLPTMQYPFLGEATGKLVLQCLQSAISEMQVAGERNSSLFSVYLDDFNDYIYPGFISVLNKSRSAGVGVVFAHQSIGDLKKVGEEFTQSFLTNTNVKIVMRSPDPESAEYFAKSIGTRTGEKATERRSRFFLGFKKNTGEQSVRDVEEYIIHPNVFKSGLGTGEGIAIIPHSQGRLVKRIKFAMVPALSPMPLPFFYRAPIEFENEAYAPGTCPLAVSSPSKGRRAATSVDNTKKST